MASLGPISVDLKVDVRASLDIYELGAAIQLCGLIEGTSVPALPALAIPTGWELLFDSPVIGGFDNKWQLWKSPGGRYAITIRGTTSKPSSLIEDLLAVMIPATGVISIDGGNLPYCFARNPASCVHFGFAIGALLLLLDGANGILAKIQALVPAGATLIVAGHSQGAALATLVRAFLEFTGAAASLAAINSYFLAQPKPGNDHFARDIELIPGCYRVTNDLDFVPQIPLSIQLLDSLNCPNPLSVIPGSIVFDMAARVIEGLIDHLEELALAKFTPEIAKLSSGGIFPAAAANMIPGAPASLRIAGGLNFEPCGIPITLAGKPGLNPQDTTDCAWQHHAAQYALLAAALV